MKLNITPPTGQQFMHIDIMRMRQSAPSLIVEDRLDDNSINVAVDDIEADNLIAFLDEIKLEHKTL